MGPFGPIFLLLHKTSFFVRMDIYSFLRAGIMTGVLLLAIIIVSIVFAVFNKMVVPLDYLVGSTELPLAIVVLGALFLGVCIGFVLLGIPLVQAKINRYRLKKRLAKAEKALEQYRSTEKKEE